MKMSKAERKAYNIGRQVGRAEGYAEGLHDGNPFIAIAELVTESINVIADKLQDPEFIEHLKYLNVEAEKESEGFDKFKTNKEFEEDEID